jgi:hypothetical protein
VIKGERHEGVLSLDRLAELSGFDRNKLGAAQR